MKTVVTCLVLFVLNVNRINAQQVFEIAVDSSEFKTELISHIGNLAKFLLTEQRVVVLDFDNKRVLFYKRGATLADSKVLKVVGKFGLTQEEVPFDQSANNRLNNEFTGTLYDNAVWIANNSSAEVLKFDLDGNHLGTIAGSYHILDTDGSSLYAFEGSGVYRFDDANDTFTYLKDLPEPVNLSSESLSGTTNLKIGSGRLAIKPTNDSLKVYDFNVFLQNASVPVLFSSGGANGADFEIMADKIVWSRDYYGKVLISDLNGSIIDSTNFQYYVYSYHFTDDQLVVVGPREFWSYDNSISQTESHNRESFYLNLVFQGGDSGHLYFYDLSDGGFVAAPVDANDGTYFYDPKNEFDYSGWQHELRVAGDDLFLLSEWPPDSFKVYRFNLQDKSTFSFGVPRTRGIDIVGETVYLQSGTRIHTYTRDGLFQGTTDLTNLGAGNLAGTDSISNTYFASNDEHFFIAYNNKLNLFDHDGQFETMYDFDVRFTAHLFADETTVISTYPLAGLLIETGQVASFLVDTPVLGYVHDDLYWHEGPGPNTYVRATTVLTDVNADQRILPDQFALWQNYPNPFNPSTKIVYHLPVNAQVELSVFNLLGQKVRTLFDGLQATGTYTIEWDGLDDHGIRLASGVYLYKMTSAGITETRSMVLLR